MFNKWSEKVKIIAEYIKTNKQRKKENTNILSNLISSNLIYNHSVNKIAKMDKNFWIYEKCNRCGICQKIGKLSFCLLS
ncbi:hypothetical protein [Clostridium bowmanii]|uniref:hypothetical protein n=1 Tax=Clostridium bowmanii TaxID=132925 RepID=UPI001C0CB322|nr:hypothetical protein [Clostridium bowmanii]MBU3189652.1 hypothetical protein [Clostridium bowmanii]